MPSGGFSHGLHTCDVAPGYNPKDPSSGFSYKPPLGSFFLKELDRLQNPLLSATQFPRIYAGNPPSEKTTLLGRWVNRGETAPAGRGLFHSGIVRKGMMIGCRRRIQGKGAWEDGR